MTDLDLRLASLSPAKRALLERMSAPAPSIPRIADGPAPLSAEQRRLWYLLQVAGDYPIYTIPVGFRLRGEVDDEALLGALRDLVARHESLRTAFRESAGEPVQEPTDGAAFAPEVLDLRGEEWAEPEANYQTDAFVRRRFRLGAGETFRAMLIHEAPGEHRLLLVLHHLAGDGASAATLLSELSALYAARRAGGIAALPAPGPRFRDWAAWQRNLPAAGFADAEAYWRRELEGARTLLDLPLDHPRPAAQGWDGARRVWEIDRGTAGRIGALARRLETTPYAVAAAAFGLLLSRYSSEEDLLIGTVLANRPRPELRDVVGFFSNTVPLRVRLEGDPTVSELVRRVHAAAAGAHAHGAVPFDRIVDLAGVRRDFRRPPLVQAVIGYTEGVGSALALPGVEIEPVTMESGTSIFELSLLLDQQGDRLMATLQYSTSLWDADTATRLTRHLEALLAGFCATPDAPVSRLSLAAADEVAALAGWTGGGPVALSPGTLHGPIERWAAERPDDVAVRWSGGSVSYGELGRRSARAAAALRALGVGPEVRVGVCMRRTPDMIAAALAVLRAGGVWVPLDPTHPESRRQTVLRMAGASLVVVDEAAGWADAARPMRFDALDAEPVQAPPADPASLAYVLFTSGSTGGPKGVEIEHRSAAALVAWMRDSIPAEERAVVLGSSAITFDVSVGEIFGTLSWGGALVLIENALAELPPGPPPTLAAITPTAAAELLEMGRFPAVRTVLLGGEPVPQRLVDALHQLPSVRRVLNGYGPTEDTVYTTCGPLEPDAERVSLGRPIAGGTVQVLDGALRPAGIGVPGEAWTSGAGIARGYAGRPGLTAERFLPDPHGPAGSRMYRTLDRLRWLPDGTLEYLGRADAQVKLRGYRIELGEVEGAAASHPAVASAAVAIRGEGDGRMLVAYLVARPGVDAPSPAELRAWVRDRLPEYMLPGAWCWMDALPRTASGKLDRRALPDPQAEAPAALVEPESELERRLCGLWAEVLGVERVGATDDFFDLGGQSILATRLVARVRTELEVELPVSQLLQAPTVRAMAEAIEARERKVRPPLIPLQAFGERRPFFLAHPAGGHVVCYRALAVLMAPYQPVYALQPRGIDDGMRPIDDLPAMAAYYLEAIRRLQPVGPYRLGGWSFGGVLAWEMARQLAEAGERVEMLAMLDTAPIGEDGIRIDPRETAEVVWSTVAGLAGFAAASRVDVETLRGMEPREAALAMIRGIQAPRILDESRIDDVLALTAVRGANLRAQIGYTPLPLDVHVTYFRTAGSALTEDAGHAVEFWSELARGGITVHPVTGSHGLILNEPHVHAVVNAVLALGDG